jgi:hypothetical protein
MHDALNLFVVTFDLNLANGPRLRERTRRRREDVFRKWQELAAPAGGGTTKGAESPLRGTKMLHGRHFGLVEGLAASLKLQSTGFEHAHLQAETRKALCQQ